MNRLNGSGLSHSASFGISNHALNMVISPWQAAHGLIEEARCSSYRPLDDIRVRRCSAGNDQLPFCVPEGLCQLDIKMLNRGNRYRVQDIYSFADLRVDLGSIPDKDCGGRASCCCLRHAYDIPRCCGFQSTAISILSSLDAVWVTRCPYSGTSSSHRPYGSCPGSDFGFVERSNRFGRSGGERSDHLDPCCDCFLQERCDRRCQHRHYENECRHCSKQASKGDNELYPCERRILKFLCDGLNAIAHFIHHGVGS